MKKVLVYLLAAIIMFGAIQNVAEAAVGSVSAFTQKKNDILTVFVKNSDNNKSVTVSLELQKDGEYFSSDSVSASPDEQVKTTFKLTDKGKYRVKYTVGDKSSHTTTVTVK